MLLCSSPAVFISRVGNRSYLPNTRHWWGKDTSGKQKGDWECVATSSSTINLSHIVNARYLSMKVLVLIKSGVLLSCPIWRWKRIRSGVHRKGFARCGSAQWVNLVNDENFGPVFRAQPWSQSASPAVQRQTAPQALCREHAGNVFTEKPVDSSFSLPGAPWCWEGWRACP